MTLEEFAQLVPGLSGMSHVDKIRHFAWFLLTQEGKDRFSPADVRHCYERLHFAGPSSMNRQFQHMSEKKPPDLLKDSKGYRLEVRLKGPLDSKYGTRPETIAVAAALQNLPGKISDEAERLFLSEALNCFRAKAFRGTIVMTWNLAYDHLLNWLVAAHLPTFNPCIANRNPRKAAVVIRKKDDFEELKESEVIGICGTTGIINGNIKKILVEKLNKRNMAAHPSLVEIGQHQAEDVITDLVNNVILKLA
jgi:hypothetical protein